MSQTPSAQTLAQLAQRLGERASEHDLGGDFHDHCDARFVANLAVVTADLARRVAELEERLARHETALARRE